MTRSISSYPKNERNRVIQRRLAQDKVKGLGYWAAYDARSKQLGGADPIKSAIKKSKDRLQTVISKAIRGN